MSFKELKVKYDFKPELDVEGCEVDYDVFKAMISDRSNFRINTGKSNYIDHYLKYNRNEAESYQKFVNCRKTLTDSVIDTQRTEIDLKWKRIEPMVSVKKTPIQDIVPKFFLSKLLQMRTVDKLSGKVKDPNQSIEASIESPRKLDDSTSSPQLRKSPNHLSKPSLINPQLADTKLRILDGTPNIPGAKTPFSHMLTNFKSHAYSKINYSNNLTLELKDLSAKQGSSVICAREGFVMVISKSLYTKQVKDLCVLGGIGSDIVQTYDHYGLASKLLINRQQSQNLAIRDYQDRPIPDRSASL